MLVIATMEPLIIRSCDSAPEETSATTLVIEAMSTATLTPSPSLAPTTEPERSLYPTANVNARLLLQSLRSATLPSAAELSTPALSGVTVSGVLGRD